MHYSVSCRSAAIKNKKNKKRITEYRVLAVSPCFQFLVRIIVCRLELIFSVQMWQWYRSSQLTLCKKVNKHIFPNCPSISSKIGLTVGDRKQIAVSSQALCCHWEAKVEVAPQHLCGRRSRWMSGHAVTFSKQENIIVVHFDDPYLNCPHQKNNQLLSFL